MRAKIIGTGSYVPKKIVTNDDLAQILDTSDEWIHSRTGIRERRQANFTSDESCSTMGLIAAERALEMANIKASELDLIITATATPDFRLPSVSCLIQERLGISLVPAFDLSAACAGSIYGLSVADNFIRSGTCKNVLFISSEVMSSVLDMKDRNTAVLFGDGASAAILSRNENTDAGFIDIDLYADGRLKEVIHIPTGGSLHPFNADNIGKTNLVMNGRETYKIAVRAMTDAVLKITEDNNVALSDIKFAVPHQANLRIIDAIATRLSIPMEKFLINLDRYANTSAASLLLAYDEANRKSLLKPGDIVVMLAIGAGFVWGAGLYKV